MHSFIVKVISMVIMKSYPGAGAVVWQIDAVCSLGRKKPVGACALSGTKATCQGCKAEKAWAYKGRRPLKCIFHMQKCFWYVDI